MRRAILRLALVGITMPVTAPLASAQKEMGFEAFVGGAWNLPLPLSIDHENERIRLTARFRTDPFAFPLYWSVRFRHGAVGGSAIELELTHHKLFLDNPKPPIDHFEVTHGHNLLTASLAKPLGRATWRAGLGAVIAHVEQDIRGQRVETGGYHLAGPVGVLGVGRRYSLGGRGLAVTAAPELRLSASWSRIGYDAGRVTVPNVALHFVAGLGVRRRW